MTNIPSLRAFPGVGTRHAECVRYSSAGEKTHSKRRQLESSKSSTSGRAKVDRAMEGRRREMASQVAFLRGDAGQWLTTSSRNSRKRTSDRAETLESEVTLRRFALRSV